MNRIKEFISPPVFPGDENKTRDARILYVTLLNFMGFITLLQITFLFKNFIPYPNYWISFIFWIVCILAFIGMRKGWIRFIGISALLLAYACATFSIINLGTIRVPLTSAYFALVIIAGLLFELPGLVISIVVNSATIAGLIWAQNAGLLPQPNLAVTIVQWMTYFALFISNGSLIIVVLRWKHEALTRAEEEIRQRKQIEQELRESHQKLELTNVQLTTALGEVKTLSGLLPICSNCKKIRDDQGYWNLIEEYIGKHTDATFTHGVCPDCAKKLYPFYTPKESST